MDKEIWVMRSQVAVKKPSLPSMHGTQFRLSWAYFPDEYLTCVGYMPSVPDTSPVYFRRSRAFEMKDPRDRVGASRLLLGALKYIRSGEAKIATLQGKIRTIEWKPPGYYSGRSDISGVGRQRLLPCKQFCWQSESIHHFAVWPVVSRFILPPFIFLLCYEAI